MKAVSIRLKAVVCELAMLPEIFSSAKDCARIPVTAVVRAPKIPMTSSPTAFGPSGRTRKESRNAARDGASAAPEDEGEIDQSLKRKGPPAKDGPFLLLPAAPGRICRTSDARVFLFPLPLWERMDRRAKRRRDGRGVRTLSRCGGCSPPTRLAVFSGSAPSPTRGEGKRRTTPAPHPRRA